MFEDDSINIHYRSPTSRLLKMNTLNEFELNRIRRLYHEQLMLEAAGQSRLKRSRSTRWSGASADGRGSLQRQGVISPQLDLDYWRHIIRHTRQQAAQSQQYGHFVEPAGVDVNRYQHAFLHNARSAARQQRQGNRSSDMIRFGRVLFNFQAKHDREISVRQGDLVEINKVIDHNWALVEDCQSGLQGLVPLSYLDYSVGCAVAKRDVSGDQRLGASRSQPHLAGHRLLPMSKGEPITLLRRLEGQWYEASNTRQAMGLVWSIDLDIIKKPVLVGSSNEDIRYKQNRTTGCTTSTKSLDPIEVDFSDDQSGDSEFLENWDQTELRRRARSASGLHSRGYSNEHHKRDHHTSTSSTYIVDHKPQLPPKPCQQDGRQQARTGEVLPRLCRAKFAYKPRQKDELELVVGDILMVVHECDDGWFIGSSYSTKEMGTFPGNFVEVI